MSKKYFKLAIFILAVTMVITLTGYSLTFAADQSKVYRLGIRQNPETFNPLVTNSSYAVSAWDLIYARLVQFNPDLEPVPYLATWEIKENGKNYIFNIKPEAKWHDGRPVTARDVLMTLKLNVNKMAAGVWNSKLKDIVGVEEYRSGESDEIEGVKIIDDKTFSIQLKERNASFLQALTYIYILPSYYLGDVSPEKLNTHSFFQKPVGAGPFKFVEEKTDQYIELESFDDFVSGKPEIDRVIIRIGTQDALLALLEKGELDVAPIPPLEAKRMENLDNIKVYSEPIGSVQVAMLNLDKSYLKDKRVRKAFTYAIDREGIVESLLMGHAEVVNAPFNRPAWALSDNLNPYRYDSQEAKALLEEAGWDSNTEVTITVPIGNKPRENAAVVMQQSLLSIGVNARVEKVDFSKFLSALNDGTFDIALAGWLSFQQDPQLSEVAFRSQNTPDKGGSNYSYYSNSRVDEIYDLASGVTSLKERGKLFKELQEILNDELPWIPLYAENEVFAVNKRIEGFKPMGLYSIGVLSYATWNIHEIDIK